MSQMWNRNRIFSELMSYNYRTRLQRFVLKKDIFKAFSKLSFMETFVFQVFPGPSLLLLAAVLDSLCFVVCRRNRRVSSSRQGRGCLVWDQSVVWVGGVRPVVGGWGGGLLQHMVCNCGLVHTENGGSVMKLMTCFLLQHQTSSRFFQHSALSETFEGF